jgi:hypothetical protein
MTETTKPAAGRLDILANRLIDRYVLPAIEKKLGVPGLAGELRPIAREAVADCLPQHNIFRPGKRRRQC